MQIVVAEWVIGVSPHQGSGRCHEKSAAARENEQCRKNPTGESDSSLKSFGMCFCWFANLLNISITKDAFFFFCILAFCIVCDAYLGE